MTAQDDQVAHQSMPAIMPTDGEPASECADQALIAAISAGDSSALETLYDRYAAVVYRVALRMLKSPELAEDLVQEVFWRVWRRSASFKRDSGHVTRWLFGIAHNLCIDELRRMRSRPAPAYENADHSVILQLVDEQTDVPAAVWATERHRVIVNALRQLPRAQRQAITLAYFGGMSQQEIATKLGRSLGTIKTRVRLGQNKLSGLLAALGLQSSDGW